MTTHNTISIAWLDGNSTHMKSNDQNAANLIELIFHIFVQFVILKFSSLSFLMRNDKTAEKNKSNKTDEMSSI